MLPLEKQLGAQIAIACCIELILYMGSAVCVLFKCEASKRALLVVLREAQVRFG